MPCKTPKCRLFQALQAKWVLTCILRGRLRENCWKNIRRSTSTTGTALLVSLLILLSESSATTRKWIRILTRCLIEWNLTGHFSFGTKSKQWLLTIQGRAGAILFHQIVICRLLLIGAALLAVILLSKKSRKQLKKHTQHNSLTLQNSWWFAKKQDKKSMSLRERFLKQ